MLRCITGITRLGRIVGGLGIELGGLAPMNDKEKTPDLRGLEGLLGGLGYCRRYKLKKKC